MFNLVIYIPIEIYQTHTTTLKFIVFLKEILLNV